MDLKIFDVEHGACALATCDDNTRMMLDCGHNATTKWYPSQYLLEHQISRLDMLTITNYDEDHVRGLPKLLDDIDVRWLWRNTGVTSKQIKLLKSETGMGNGIEALCNAIDHTFTGNGNSPQPTFQGLVRSAYRHDYPTFEDENNLSLVVLLEFHGRGVLFTGDLEKAGWLELIKREDFRDALAKTNVLLAPHHGREGGCCEEAMAYCKNLYYVVISDKGYMHDTQQTIPFYRKFAKGGPFRGDTRRVLTTRKDARIGFSFTTDSWRPY